MFKGIKNFSFSKQVNTGKSEIPGSIPSGAIKNIFATTGNTVNDNLNKKREGTLLKKLGILFYMFIPTFFFYDVMFYYLKLASMFIFVYLDNFLNPSGDLDFILGTIITLLLTVYLIVFLITFVFMLIFNVLFFIFTKVDLYFIKKDKIKAHKKHLMKIL